MSVGLNIEDALERGIIARLALRTFFGVGGAGHGTPMKQVFDNSITSRPAKYLVVHAQAEQVMPNSPLWKISVKLVSLTHIPDDLDCSGCKTLYKECLSYFASFDKAGLTSSLTGITIQGINTIGKQQEAAIDAGSGYQSMVANAEIFLQTN